MSTNDLTARIAALEARGYELTAFAQNTIPTREELELLTALEQAEGRVEQAKRQGDERAAFWITCWQSKAMQAVIGAARLKLAEQRIAELEAAYADLDARFDHQMQAEAALAAERRRGTDREAQLGEVLQSEKDAHSITIQELAAERAKRCATCDCREGESFYCLVWSRSFPSDFGCTEHQPRNQVPNVAQAGDERDAEGTEEASDGSA